MSRFTQAQYDAAIADLRDAATQLAPDGDGCHVCGDSGHQAFECGSNPLLAEAVCHGIAERASDLHDEMHRLEEAGVIGNGDTGPDGAMFDKLHTFLHYLAGHDIRMGHQVGPAAVRPRQGKT